VQGVGGVPALHAGWPVGGKGGDSGRLEQVLLWWPADLDALNLPPLRRPCHILRTHTPQGKEIMQSVIKRLRRRLGHAPYSSL